MAPRPTGGPDAASRRAGVPGGPRGERDPERRRALLEARARALAEAREAPAVEGVPILAFRLEGRPLALEIAAVSQVVEVRGIWPLPASPSWLIGALVARTRIVPVLDLRPLLAMPSVGAASLRRVIVVEQGDAAYGMAVSSVDGRRDVHPTEVVPPPAGPFLWSTADGLAVLDPGALAPPEQGGGPA